MTEYKVVDSIPNEIFRAYDIRGIVDETFSDDNIYTIGLAIGSEALARDLDTIAVGRDGRISGPRLLKPLIAGILASGCSVKNVEEVTTPILYYKAATIDSKSGVMLSGSHNPPNYNGIKMVLGGNTLYGEDIQKLYQRIINKDFKSGEGKVDRVEVINEYMERVKSDVKLNRPLKIVIDCGNGVGGIVAPELFRSLGCEVIELYCEVDGSFPNHQPDPLVHENLNDLIKAVKDNNADIGLAFDGDADRVGIVTEKGEIIAADRLLIFLAIDFLTRHPGITIPFDVKCTRHLADQIEKHGGKPLMYKTGHSLIKAKMKELGSELAGELSGHIFIKERWYGFDDGVYVAARFLEILTKGEKSSSEVFSEIPDSANTPEIKIPISEDRKFQFMGELVKNADFPGGEIHTIDGLRVDYEDGFGLVRPSNTSPYLTTRFEGDTEEALDRIKNSFREALLKIDPALELSI